MRPDLFFRLECLSFFFFEDDPRQQRLQILPQQLRIPTMTKPKQQTARRAPRQQLYTPAPVREGTFRKQQAPQEHSSIRMMILQGESVRK